MQKARCHPIKGLQLLVSVWFQVLFHSSVRGSFRLSFTVLVRYRYLMSIQPYRMVPANSHRASPTPRYSGYYQVISEIRVRGYHLLWRFFPETSTFHLQSTLQSYNPCVALTTQVWAVPRSLATTWGITICFLFLWVLRCFSSPGWHFRGTPSMCRVPPFRNLRI